MRTRAGASPPTSSTTRPSYGRVERRRRTGDGGPEPSGRGMRRAAPNNLVGSALESRGYARCTGQKKFSRNFRVTLKGDSTGHGGHDSPLHRRGGGLRRRRPLPPYGRTAQPRIPYAAHCNRPSISTMLATWACQVLARQRRSGYGKS